MRLEDVTNEDVADALRSSARLKHALEQDALPTAGQMFALVNALAQILAENARNAEHLADGLQMTANQLAEKTALFWTIKTADPDEMKQ